jgi:hypothetical protein
MMKHPPDVQLDAVSLLAVPEIERRAARQVEELNKLLPAFSLSMRPGQRRLEVMGHVRIELVVILLGDLRRRLRPERRGLVDLFVLVRGNLRCLGRIPPLLLHENRERDVIRVFAQDLT